MSASYFTLKRGTPVSDRFGRPVGWVKEVLIAYHTSFDGLVVTTECGDRFVDAPEVRRITERAVELGVAAADVLRPGPGGPLGPPDVRAVPGDRIGATDDDRAGAVAQLTAAFVGDRLDLAELERRIELVHEATRLDELDHVLAGVTSLTVAP